MLDSRCWPKVCQALASEEFYYERHRTIYQAFYRIANRGLGIDVITTGQDLKEHNKLEEAGGAHALALLIEHACIAYHLDSYILIIKECAIKRYIMEAAIEAINAIRREAPVAEIFLNIKRKIDACKIP
jgi:replicative DNA helicase